MARPDPIAFAPGRTDRHPAGAEQPAAGADYGDDQPRATDADGAILTAGAEEPPVRRRGRPRGTGGRPQRRTVERLLREEQERKRVERILAARARHAAVGADSPDEIASADADVDLDDDGGDEPLPAIPSAPKNPNDRRGAGKRDQHIPFSMSDADRARHRLRQKAPKNASGVRELPTLPGVQSISLATRYLPGGRAKFLAYVQLAALNRENAAIDAWWMVFTSLTEYEQDLVNYDDVCAAAGVKPYEFMAAVVSATMKMGRDAGNLIAATMQDKVIAAAARSAKRIAGANAQIALEDRKTLLQHYGVAPIPKGTSVHVHANASAQAAAAAASEPSVPNFAGDLDALSRPAGQSLQQLPAADPSLDLVIPADVVAVPAQADYDDEGERVIVHN